MGVYRDILEYTGIYSGNIQGIIGSILGYTVGIYRE